VALSILLLRSAILEMPMALDVFDVIQKGSLAEFPIRPYDLMSAFSGVELGQELKRLEKLWIDSGFTLDRAALLGPDHD